MPQREPGQLDENMVAELVRRNVVTDTFRRLPTGKKARLYRVSIRLFGEYGYDGLAIDQLCDEAGISKGSFFQYFPSKTHLLEFAILMFDRYLDGWVTEIRQHEQAVLARDRLLHLYRSVVVNSILYEAEEKFYLFVTRALQHAAVALVGIDFERHFNDYITEIIRRGEETGEIRGDFDIDTTAHLVALVIGGLVGIKFGGSTVPRRQAEDYLVSFLFDGIKA